MVSVNFREAAAPGGTLSRYVGAAEIVERFFPPQLQQAFLSGQVQPERVAEIRCRRDRPVLVRLAGGEELVLRSGGEVVILAGEMLAQMVQRINQSSVYAWEEEYRRGYLTLAGGHRVGLAGKALLEQGEIRTMKNISSLNFRIAHEVLGAADEVMPYICQGETVRNTLLVAPPGCGKTTLLRDITRQLSDGVPPVWPYGVNVGLVDERSELAGTVGGAAQLKVGRRTDILDGCPKSEGMQMLIRAMSPQVIVTDEIGTLADVQAMQDALNAGVAVITSIHGRQWSDLEGRSYLAPLLEQHFFQCLIFLSNRQGAGTVERVLTWREHDYVPWK